MPAQDQLDQVYMQTAVLHSGLSKATRKKVGAVLVTANGTTLTGYNGTPSGLNNSCEWFNSETNESVTRPEVIHAELNCILKAAKEGISCVGSTVYVTLSPCVPCAAMLIQAGVKEVIFLERYRDDSGIKLLRNAGIDCWLLSTYGGVSSRSY